MARILITGGYGRLAASLAAEFARLGHESIAFSRRELDVTDATCVESTLEAYRPAIVVNCAGVLSIESERDHRRAWDVNVTGAANVAAAANCRVVQISTDYVFSGEKRTPYLETDPPDPVNYYGLTKAAGEAAVLAADPSALIVRAPFRYDGRWPYRKAFTDQFMSGRWMREVAPDIVYAALDQSVRGILHIGGERKSVFEMAAETSPGVIPCLRSDWPGLHIPHDTTLDSSRWNRRQLAKAA